MRKNLKKIYFFSFIFGIIFVYLLNLIILRPFPFFKVNYIKSLDGFNSSPFLEKTDFYEIDLNTENISKKIRTKLDANLNEDIFQKIKVSTEITRELQSNSFGVEIKTLQVEWNKSGVCKFLRNDLPIHLFDSCGPYSFDDI